MKLRHLVISALFLLCALPSAAQYRDDQFKRDAFTQTYADTTEKATTDTSALFSFKEFFGGLAGKNKASLKTLTIGSAVFIGSNQIYNRQYWKLPIVYGDIGAGIYGGIHFNQMYNKTEDSKYKTYSVLSFVGAGLFYWGSLMDGAIMFKSERKPDPAKSTVFSMLLPGLGQIYNGEAWKVPIYWGLMAGSIHFWVDNERQYQRWKWIHNQATTSETLITEKPPWSGENAKYYRDVYRRYRDYAILFTAVAYVLQIIDANVFAYMQDFDVSDDISMRIEPAVLPLNYASHFTIPSSPAVGMRIGIKF